MAALYPSVYPYVQGAALVGSGLSAANTVIHEGRKLYRSGRAAVGYASSSKKRKADGPAVAGGGRGTDAGYAGKFKGKRVKRLGKRRYPSKKRTPKRRSYKRKRSRVIKGENYYARSGGITTREVSGSLSDPDCVYLGHSSVCVGDALAMIAIAMVRKIFKLGIGYEPDNERSIIPYRTTGAVGGAPGAQDSLGAVLLFKRANTDTGVKSDLYYTTTNVDTIASVANWVKANVLDVYSAEAAPFPGTATLRNSKLLWMQLLDDNTRQVRAHIDLTTMYVDLYSKSNLKIQNVTVPTLTATEADNVTNVPLTGRHYHMNAWQPVTGDDDMTTLNWVNQDTGVLSVEIKAFSGVLGQQYLTWKEPPPSKAFVNCVSSDKIHLEPGTIKSHMSTCRRRMTLENMLKALCQRIGDVRNRSVKIGRHDLFAMERMISMDGDLDLKIRYECNFFTGVSVSYRNRPALMQTLNKITQGPTLIPQP